MQGKRVLVTGATKGIGAGIATAFAQVGAHVVITGRNVETAIAAAATIATSGNGKVLGIGADLSNPEHITRMVAEATAWLGGLDVLCANAGIFPGVRLSDMTASDIDEVFNVNVRGTMLSVIASLPALRESEQGRVVVTSSITGPHTGYPGWSHYAASKAAQLGFVRSAALELAPDQITINAILPGNVLTEGLADKGQDYLDSMTRSIPLGRLATVADIGAAAVFLASTEASYITGQTLVIDGGQLLPESADAMDAI